MADFPPLASLLSIAPQATPSLANLGRYGPRILPENYNTQLPLMDELQFRQWLQQNKVPFDPNAQRSDYDMRGFYQAAQQQQPNMTTQINPNDLLIHYPDRFKTPIHKTFSNESQWAGSGAPQWINDAGLPVSQLAQNGRIVYDERNR